MVQSVRCFAISPVEVMEAQQQKLEQERLRLERLAQEQGKKIAKVEHCEWRNLSFSGTDGLAVDPKGQTKRWFKKVTVDEFKSKGKELAREFGRSFSILTASFGCSVQIHDLPYPLG